jgi:hypothetical protein
MDPLKDSFRVLADPASVRRDNPQDKAPCKRLHPTKDSFF